MSNHLMRSDIVTGVRVSVYTLGTIACNHVRCSGDHGVHRVTCDLLQQRPGPEEAEAGVVSVQVQAETVVQWSPPLIVSHTLRHTASSTSWHWNEILRKTVLCWKYFKIPIIWNKLTFCDVPRFLFIRLYWTLDVSIPSWQKLINFWNCGVLDVCLLC